MEEDDDYNLITLHLITLMRAYLDYCFLVIGLDYRCIIYHDKWSNELSNILQKIYRIIFIKKYISADGI